MTNEQLSEHVKDLRDRADHIEDVQALDILEAKARVCDAYRDWLAKPNQTTRKPICDALVHLSQVEAQPTAAGQAAE